MRCFRVTVAQSGYLGISAVTWLLAALLAALPVQAQSVQAPLQTSSDSAGLTGSVRDSTGRPVAGALVYLQVKDGTQTLSVHADPAGSYHFSALREGIYMLRAEMAGYSSAEAGPCVLGVGETKRLDLTLVSPKALQASASDKPGAASPEFFDEPKFTVAGVTDGTNLGGHGSNAIVRTKESLAKDIVSLSVSGDQASPTSLRPASRLPADSSEATLRAAAAREPDDFEANHRLGKFLVDDGKAPEALAYLQRASQLKPDDYENSYRLAMAYANADQYQNARAQAEALLTVPARADAGLAQPGPADVHHLMGDIEEKSGHPLEAVSEYQRAAKLNPSETNLFDWGSELLLHRAAEPAIEVFSEGNRLFPHSARMLIALGVAWYSNGSYDQAAQRLCEASDLNPGDPKPYVFLGKIQSVETSQSECSVERLKRFVQLQPENALANYYYGVSLWKRRKGPEDAETAAQAESQLQRAVQLDPILGAGYLQLGILYSERQDFPRAISNYQLAIEASPELEEAHYHLAQAYKRTGEKAKVEDELKLYNQISKSKDDAIERERRESRQFVYTLRSPGTQSR